MKLFFVNFTLISIFSVPLFTSADVKVNGYHRQDGTYVKPHYRSDADGVKNNNWTTEGNINPYTGKEGTLDRNDFERSDPAFAEQQLDDDLTVNSGYSEESLPNEHKPINAKYFIGENIKVCGYIANVYKFKKGYYLNFDNKFPKQSLTGVIWDDQVQKHEKSLGAKIDLVTGNNVCLYGDISSYKGRIDITPTSNIVIK